MNFAVTVESANQAITVEAPAQQVDTTATLSEVVDRRRIVELPLNGRNAASLALITAGTVLAPASADEGSTKTFPVAVTNTGGPNDSAALACSRPISRPR